MAEIAFAPGRSAHYSVAGPSDAPVLVLIGGLDTPRGAWQPTIDALASVLRVVSLDNRDAGENPPETEPYSFEDLADDVAGVLGALGVDRTHVVGHSLGGMIAVSVALRHPTLVDRLVLVGASVMGAGPSNVPEARIDAKDWIDDPVERLRDRFGGVLGRFGSEWAERFRNHRMTSDGYNRQLHAVHDFDVRRVLGAISAPTLVIAGEQHWLDPRSAKVLAERIPDARLIVYPGVDHFPMVEVPDEFHADVLAFLTEGRSGLQGGEQVPARR
jgi:3-oxoadipate enol-lactonase